MPPHWTDSTRKHGVDRQDAVYAMLNATFTDQLVEQSRHGGVVELLIGPRYAQALPEDEVEVLVERFPAEPGREAVVFHVQPLSAKYRSYREEQTR